MTLENYINKHLSIHTVVERLHINNSTKPVRTRPQTKDDLINLIIDELEHQGPDANLNHIDVSVITDMRGLFHYVNKKITVGNIKIDKWDVSNVTNMEFMFQDCEYFNADLRNWDVSKVESMQGAFTACRKFDSDLSRWDTGNVVYMSGLFNTCENFDSDLSRWDTSNVISMYRMFTNASKFKSDLSHWNVSKVDRRDDMFYGCPKMTDNLKPKFQ